MSEPHEGAVFVYARPFRGASSLSARDPKETLLGDCHDFVADRDFGGYPLRTERIRYDQSAVG